MVKITIVEGAINLDAELALGYAQAAFAKRLDGVPGSLCRRQRACHRPRAALVLSCVNRAHQPLAQRSDGCAGHLLGDH